MDGSPQCGLLNATTLWHLDAAEWAPSTASFADIRRAKGLIAKRHAAARSIMIAVQGQ
jgi:hypothetical protein